MSDEIIRDAANVPDVTEEPSTMENTSATEEAVAAETADVQDDAPITADMEETGEPSAPVANYSEKTLAELVSLFEELGRNA